MFIIIHSWGQQQCICTFRYWLLNYHSTCVISCLPLISFSLKINMRTRTCSNIINTGSEISIHSLLGTFFFFSKYFILYNIFFFSPGYVACGILVPRLGFEHRLHPYPQSESTSPNHWTTREFPGEHSYKNLLTKKPWKFSKGIGISQWSLSSFRVW